MLITFKSKAHADVIMFGNIARELIRLMGKSDALPSAIGPEDIPRALQKLRSALDDRVEPESDPDDIPDEEEAPVSLDTRAGPLIELLVAAEAAQEPVIWEADTRKY